MPILYLAPVHSRRQVPPHIPGGGNGGGDPENKIPGIIRPATYVHKGRLGQRQAFPGFTSGYYADGTRIKRTDSAILHG